MSIRKGSRTIASSVPVTEWGSVDGTLADQVDLKSALDSKAPTYSPTFTGTPIAPTAPIDTSNNQIATTKYVQEALLNAEANLPEQSGNAGKFLTTNGQIPSWANIDALPSQSGQSGKFLSTNGTSASWTTITTLSSGNDISITNNAINYTGPKYYRLGTRSWTYAQWTQYCEKGVTANITPSYTVTGLKAGDLVSVEGVCTDRGNASVLAWGVTNGAPAADTNNVSVTFLGLNIQNDFGLVHLAGDETIAGSKTFTSRMWATVDDTNPIAIKDTALGVWETPSTDRHRYIGILDNGNNLISYIHSYKTISGVQHIYLQTTNSDNSSTIYSEKIGLNISNTGVVTTYAPKPTSVTDNTNNIATTSWVVDVLKAIYPVGSLYMGTQNSCPLSAFFGTWTLVSAGNALWTGNGTSGSGTTTNANYANAKANTTIAAGVPNIKDNFYFVDTYYGSVALAPNSDSGLIKYNSKTTSDSTNRSDTDGTTTSRQKYVFDASQVNSIYGKSSTVQPPAYVVNVWRRTA